MTFEIWFQNLHPGIPLAGAHTVLRLSEEGATIPFMARYRKEQTGNLDEVAIQKILDDKEKWDQILQRQKFILEEIERQKKLTPELKASIASTFQLDLLEDLYLPYKLKRKTKAATAKDAGIEPLADWLWNCGHGTETPLPGQTLELWAFSFKNEEKGFPDAATTLQGAQDILVERLSETQDLRQAVRTQTFEKGELITGKGEKSKPNSKFENYFTHHETVQSLLQPQNSHRYLAMRRGWMEEELTLSIGPSPEKAGTPEDYQQSLLKLFENEACTVHDSVGAEILFKAARLAFKGSVIPSIETEVHKALKESADVVAIHVFAENVRKLLMASPFGSKAVLGADPGIRTGCKLAAVDDSGKYLASTVMHLQTESGKENAKILLKTVVENAKIQAIAVGNGTAGRETEIFIRGALKEAGINIPVVMVNEAGASVYSASELAREEFPDLDLTVRGAISIARRMQDPLAELVKVDPKSIGVGQYQHDVGQGSLKKSLELVVDSCVNAVGVNLNTASYHLLAHVSGIGPSLAKSIVERRSAKGLFESREELLEVPRFSKKAFEQGAGFLRISNGKNPLDNTGIHPERYSILENYAKKLDKKVSDLIGAGARILKEATDLKQEIGEFTYQDILQELSKPGLDPREEFVPFQFRDDIHAVSDLVIGMVCPGIVTNVTNFGAFVDIGVHQDGLVHLSQLSDKFIKDPREVVNPGDHVSARVIEVNLEKHQIALSMKGEARARTGKSEKRENAPKHEKAARKPEKKAPQLTESQGPKIPPRSNPLPLHTQTARSNPRPLQNPLQNSQQRPLPIKTGVKSSGGQAIAPKSAFNNPFGGLASLKSNLKAK